MGGKNIGDLSDIQRCLSVMNIDSAGLFHTYPSYIHTVIYRKKSELKPKSKMTIHSPVVTRAMIKLVF